jgi:RNA:NAD 2'-phosphotransferase (TPT1/KptA family)
MIDSLKLSKIVSDALRHRPQEYGIVLKNEGWVSINELSDGIKKREVEFGALP